VSGAERARAARVGAWMFRHRGVLPLPVLLVPLCMPGHMTGASWAVGLAIVAVGEALRLTGVAAAGPVTRRRTRAVAHLVTDGPFAWSRNPIYTGNGLIWMGMAVVAGISWFIPLAVTAFAVEYGLIVRYEEAVLESTFGEAYLAYKGRTPRWVPRPPAPRPRAAWRPYDWRAAWRAETSTLGDCAAALAALGMRGVWR
jgi:protein-S-isoprenylcysteine O-methyltransferase Ste14